MNWIELTIIPTEASERIGRKLENSFITHEYKSVTN
jgi:hypothetical protein